MATQTVFPPPGGPRRPLPAFLRPWSLQNPRLASCGNHDHLALIYDNQDEQFDVVIPFLRLGLERGEKSVFIYDDTSPETVMAAMERHGIDVAAATASGALAILTRHDAYLKNGDFDPEWMIAYLREAVESAKKQGFRAVRASGEMTWALAPSGDVHDRLVEYECMLTRFFAGCDMGGICQYNRNRFRPDMLMHVIHTHPRLVFKGEVCENPYYIPAEILERQADSGSEAVRQLLESIAENSRLRRQLSAETESLRRSEKLAAAGRMAAALAHEINNPLEAIVNFWYLLGQEELSGSGRSYLNMMGGELDRISHIAKQTLEFYRAGRRVEDMDLAQEIDTALWPLSARTHALGCAIDVQHRSPARICGFPGELRQLIANLVANALDAGASRIRIRTSPGRDWRQPSRRGVRVAIADNGVGIPAGTAAKVFDPFFSTKKRKGAGLGLWVSQGIVQKHAGTILMRSSTYPNRNGTAFSIFLPAA
jgi:signal transduction histidine kinase